MPAIAQNGTSRDIGGDGSVDTVRDVVLGVAADETVSHRGSADVDSEVAVAGDRATGYCRATGENGILADGADGAAVHDDRRDVETGGRVHLIDAVHPVDELDTVKGQTARTRRRVGDVYQIKRLGSGDHQPIAVDGDADSWIDGQRSGRQVDGAAGRESDGCLAVERGLQR